MTNETRKPTLADVLSYAELVELQKLTEVTSWENSDFLSLCRKVSNATPDRYQVALAGSVSQEIGTDYVTLTEAPDWVVIDTHDGNKVIGNVRDIFASDAQYEQEQLAARLNRQHYEEQQKQPATMGALSYEQFCSALDLQAQDGGAELGSSLELYRDYLDIRRDA